MISPGIVNSSLLDEDVLVTLRRYDLIARVIPRFLAALPAVMAELLEAVALGDRQAVYRCAHRLRGMAAQMGAQALADAVGEVEAATATSADLRRVCDDAALVDLSQRTAELLARLVTERQ
jgi:HPt (histidine-containing phosphotransfer) domain-containing protein